MQLNQYNKKDITIPVYSFQKAFCFIKKVHLETLLNQTNLNPLACFSYCYSIQSKIID